MCCCSSWAGSCSPHNGHACSSCSCSTGTASICAFCCCSCCFVADGRPVHSLPHTPACACCVLRPIGWPPLADVRGHFKRGGCSWGCMCVLAASTVSSVLEVLGFRCLFPLVCFLLLASAGAANRLMDTCTPCSWGCGMCCVLACYGLISSAAGVHTVNSTVHGCW